MTTPADPPPRPPAEPPPSLGLRVAGVAVGGLGAFLLAMTGAFLTPYRIGSVLIPLSLVLVVAGLAILTRFAHSVTDHVGLSLIPGAVWLIFSLILSSRTAEGDLVLVQQNWVATGYLLVGSVTIGVLAYRMIVPRRR